MWAFHDLRCNESYGNQVGDLSDCLDNVSNRVDRLATTLYGNNAGAERLAMQLANNTAVRRVEEVLDGLATPGSGSINHFDDGNLPDVAVSGSAADAARPLGGVSDDVTPSLRSRLAVMWSSMPAGQSERSDVSAERPGEFVGARWRHGGFRNSGMPWSLPTVLLVPAGGWDSVNPRTSTLTGAGTVGRDGAG